MNERTKNIAVGITVIISLAFLGTMILIFAGLPHMLQRGYYVHMLFSATYDIAEDDPVYLIGLRVGTVTKVGFTDPQDPDKGVTITARIDPDVNIPGNTVPVVFTRGLVGKGYLQLTPEGPYPLDEQGNPFRFLPTDGSVVLKGTGRSSGLVPDEVKQAMERISRLADNLNSLIVPQVSPEQAQAAPTETQLDRTLQGSVIKLNRTLDAIHDFLGDDQAKINFKTSLENLSQASASAKQAMDALKEFADQARQTTNAISGTAEDISSRVNELSLKLIESAEEVSQVMAGINRAVMKIEAGQGTAGQLINDPKLYLSLIDATRQIEMLAGDLRQLVELWRQKGVEIRVK